MKKILPIFLLFFSIFFLSADEIVIYRGVVEGVTEYYDLETFKIGISSGAVEGKEIIKKIPYEKDKEYYIATVGKDRSVKYVPDFLYADFESSVLLLDRMPLQGERGLWELYKLSFARPSKKTLDYLYTANLDSEKSIMSEIDSIINIISSDTLYDYVAVLSGEDAYPQGTYSKSRVMVTTWLDTAYIYLKGVMDSMGFDSVYGQDFFVSTYYVKNVVGLKRGLISHDTCIVIGAHYDDYSSNYNIAPGADDNASGSAGVLEAARALMGIESDYDIYFVLFTAEEWGLYGSDYFVNDFIIPNNMHVLGMVNFDMIGYNPSASYHYDLYGMAHSLPLKNIFAMMADTFTTLTTHVLGSSSGSDHYPFDMAGFKSAFAIEYDFSPVYHSPMDSIGLLNFDYMKELVQAGTATVYYLSQMPLPVTEFTLLDNGDSSIDVSWTKTINTDIESYRIYYKKEGDTSEQFSDAPDTNDYTVLSLVPGALYTFRISPIDTTGIEAFSEATDTVRPSFVPNRIKCIDAYGDSSNIYLSFHKSNAGDISFYRIYRSINNSSFSEIDTTADTLYIDLMLSDTSVFRYTVTAVDTDGYESAFSDTLETRIVSRVKELLVIDETNNGGTALDGATDAFYDSIMGNFAFDIIDADSLAKTTLVEFALYKRILYIDDDLSLNKIDYEDLYRYVEAGGRVALAGWNIGKSILEYPVSFPAYSDSNSKARTLLGIDSYNRNTLYDLDFINYTMNGETDTIRFLETKLPRGEGKMYYGGIFSLTSGSQAKGFYHSFSGDTLFGGKPLIIATADTSVVIVAAPLFYMNTADAKNLVKNILQMFGDISSVCIDREIQPELFFSVTSNMNNVNVAFSGEKKGLAKISLIDIAGRVIVKKDILVNGGSQRISFGKELLAGVYFVNVEFSDKRYLKKVAIVK
ncbi:MAG: M28 family peptidase [bacterium]